MAEALSPERAEGVHDRIGQALAGSVMHCRPCNRTFQITAGQAARYAHIGWPTCCDETMSLQRPEGAQA